MKLVIIIPAYNEEENISNVLKRIPKTFKSINNTEIIVINDGSTDSTLEKIAKYSVTVISHAQNKGVGVAFNTGLNTALHKNADIMVNIDADGQFDPKDIPFLLEPILSKKADMVISNRFSNGRPANMSRVKYYGNKVMNKLIGFLIGKNFKDVSSGFRAYNKTALLYLNLMGNYTYTQESILDLSMKNLRISEISIKTKYFRNRKSRVVKNLFKYTSNTLLIIFRTFRDYKPMKFFGFFGMAIFLLGILPDLFVMFRYLKYGTFSPYIFIALIGIYLNTLGIAVMILGVIADMFVRMRMNQEKLLYYQKLERYGKK